MKDNGAMICNMDKVKKRGTSQVANLKVNLLVVFVKATVNGQLKKKMDKSFTKVLGKTT